MIKCICFARVSTLQQDLTAQIEAVKRQAKADGYLDSEIVAVEGKESAIKLAEEQRQTLKELKELIKINPTVESIYFFAVDRLARRMSVIFSVKEWADNNNINLVFLNPHYMSTLRIDEYGNRVEDDMTNMLLSMLAYGAQMEMKTKKARFKTVKESMRKQGKITEGKALFGYKIDENRYIIPDEEETAPIVRGIFNDYLTGNYTLVSLYNKYVKNSVFDVVSSINAQKTKIHHILTDQHYAGYEVKSKYKNRFTGILSESTTKYPPIISEDIFNQTQALLKSKLSKPKTDTKHIYYGKGLVKCHCGRTMTAVGGSLIYRCKDFGHNFTININVVDSLIWNTAKAWYAYYASIDLEQTKAVNKLKIEDYEAEIRILEEKISFEQDKKDKIAIKYANGKVSETVFDNIVEGCDENIKKYNNLLSDWKAKIVQLNYLLIESESKDYIIASDLNNLSDSERVKIIKNVIKEVKVTRIDEYFKIELFPTDALDFVPRSAFNTHYMYWVQSRQYQRLSAWIGDKCINPDVSFLIHKRFTKKPKAKKEE